MFLPPQIQQKAGKQKQKKSKFHVAGDNNKLLGMIKAIIHKTNNKQL